MAKDLVLPFFTYSEIPDLDDVTAGLNSNKIKGGLKNKKTGFIRVQNEAREAHVTSNHLRFLHTAVG